MTLRGLMTLLLLCVLGALTYWLGTAMAWGEAVKKPLQPVRMSAATAPEVKVLPNFVLAPETSYQQMVDRPVFTPTRALAPPPVPVQPVNVIPTMQKGQYVLTGAIVAGDIKVAYLREVRTNKNTTVKEGESLSGMLLEKVEPRQVTLRFNTETELLDLNITNGGAARPAPPPPPGIAAFPGAPPLPGQPGYPGAPPVFAGPAGMPPPSVITPSAASVPGATAQSAAPTGMPSKPDATATGQPPPAVDESRGARRRQWQSAQ